MAERQAGEDGDRGTHAAQVGHQRSSACSRGPAATLRQPVNSPSSTAFCAPQHAGLVQLQQRTLDAVRVLVDVFQEQHAARTFGQCGVPSSELCTIARLPPQSVPRTSRPSKPASVRKPTASSSPDIASVKQPTRHLVDAAGGVGAAEVVAGHRALPAAVAPVCASRPSCSAVRSLWPTQRVPCSTDRASSGQSMRSSSRVRP
jgi:hypothetical protein